jgi:hypothetical protein
MRRPLITLVCASRRCHAKGRPQPAGRFRRVTRGRETAITATCATCRRRQRTRSERHRLNQKREALLAREMKRSRLGARVHELTRQLRTERAARIALATEVETLKAHFGVVVLP